MPATPEHPDGRGELGAMALSGTERRVLAALVRRPHGLVGAAAVADAAGVTHDDARAALGRLAQRHLVRGESQPERGRGTTRRVTVWRLLVGDAWFAVAEDVRSVRLPQPTTTAMPKRLPRRFQHLFWWGEPTGIELPRDAAFVAEHLLARHDIEAWAWVVATLPAATLERVARKEHTSPPTRAMIRNTLKHRDGIALGSR